MHAETTRPTRQGSLLPKSLNATEASALKARISRSESLYHPAEMHLDPNSQDSEQHLYVNLGAFKGSDFDNNNALVTLHSYIYNGMMETNEKSQAKWLAGRLASETSSRIV